MPSVDPLRKRVVRFLSCTPPPVSRSGEVNHRGDWGCGFSCVRAWAVAACNAAAAAVDKREKTQVRAVLGAICRHRSLQKKNFGFRGYLAEARRTTEQKRCTRVSITVSIIIRRRFAGWVSGGRRVCLLHSWWIPVRGDGTIQSQNRIRYMSMSGWFTGNAGLLTLCGRGRRCRSWTCRRG
jgi:hypothetical protein